MHFKGQRTVKEGVGRVGCEGWGVKEGERRGG